MRLKKFISPMSILLFLALTLAGTYFVRLRILEKDMVLAMDKDDKAAVAELAHSFPSPVNARDKDGRTPLHRAAEWSDRALAERLLRKGADVNSKTTPNWEDNTCCYNRTPLHLAAANGHEEVAELLIAKGADINARDNDGRTALQLAISVGFSPVAEVLRKAGAKE